jgi:undecaprenyl-diphosphatase
LTILDAIILGILQGLTEFLPISSTAHLTIAGKLMGLVDPQHPEQWTAFIAVIQLGTMLAVLAYFTKEVIAIMSDIIADGKAFVKREHKDGWRWNTKLGWYIVIGTLPVAVIGLVFKKIIEGSLTKSLTVIAISLIGLAIVLLLAELLARHERKMQDVTWKDSLWIGFAQALALIPGSSRSGTTITAGLLLGLQRDAAARFSFLLSIPAVFASGLFELYQIRHEIGSVGSMNLIIATVVSFFSGYAAIAFLLKYLRSHSTFVFIWYRILLGGVVLLVLRGMME